MKGFILALVYCLLAFVSQAQNLVPNPSFEFFYQCPPYPGQIHEATSWDSPLKTTTDFFHRCAPIASGSSVPENIVGFQEPATGDGYVGIRTWIPRIDGNPPYREYLSTTLIRPLEKGKVYELSFKVSVGDNATFLSDKIGLYLSATPFESALIYYFQPQLTNTQGQIIKEKEGWITISGTYQASGGEQFLIIGNFYDDENTDRIPTSGNQPMVYFYIDDVEIRSCLEASQPFTFTDTVFCEGQPVALAGRPESLSYKWSNGSERSSIWVNQPGIYQVTSIFSCYFVSDTYSVNFADCACNLRIPTILAVYADFEIQNNSVIREYSLHVFDVSGKLVQKLSPENPILQVSASGAYFWKATVHCENGPSILQGKILAFN